VAALGPDAAKLAETIAKQEIADLLVRYCRGVDRCDLETLRSVFWPDATAQYGAEPQSAWLWAEQTLARLRRMQRTQHSISNVLIAIDGDRATAETYCRAYHELAGDDGPQEMVVGGRYLDRLERRGDAWRIAHRLYVMDWNRNGPSTAMWDGPLYGRLTVRGGRFPDDPFYKTGSQQNE
jgi:hypothetical protein